MTDVVSLHNDNAQHYIKDFFTHLSEDKINLQDFKSSAKSKIMSSIGIKKSLYEDVKSFYSNKKSNLFLLKDDNTNQYKGHFIVKFNKLEENELSTHIKPQKFSSKDGFGVDEKDGEGYLSLSKMSVKKGFHNEKNIFQSCYIGVFEKLNSLKVPQIVINSKSNETFDILCKFCEGKKIECKNGFNYVIPVDVENVKKAFQEMEIIKIVRREEVSIGEIIGAMKQAIENKNISNISINKTPSNVSSAISRLNQFKQISRK